MLDNVCVCCGKTIPEGRQVCKSCETEGQRMGLLSKPAVVTNGDRIRAMSDEQLADILSDKCAVCDYKYGRCDSQFCVCMEGIREWLKQEASP